MIEIKWKTRKDNTEYFTNPVLSYSYSYSYFIYPPQYDNDDQKLPILSILDANGNVVTEKSFNNIETAKAKANMHLNKAVQSFISFEKLANRIS